MPKLTIDGTALEVAPGTTVLQAAQQLGIDIPTLCYLKGYRPSTSCLVCVVRIRTGAGGPGRVAPSCGTVAEDGMQVESETEDVHHLRRTALELLLSDHLGDCLAPCHFACPAHMDVPGMLRSIAAHEPRRAIAIIKRDIALPAVLGRVCPKPCEKGCRRAAADGAVAVCQLKRFIADQDLASGEPYVPACATASGRRVAIVGAGPAGLAAAFHLAQQGHACTVFDDQPNPGGRLHHEFTPAELPADVLAAEIKALLRVGVELRSGARVDAAKFHELRAQFDAVLVACGTRVKDEAAAWGLPIGPRGIPVKRDTFETSLSGVFAAGNAIRTKGMVVRSVADGKEAACAIHQFLSGALVTGPEKPFSVRRGRLEADELHVFVASASLQGRKDPSPEGYAAQQAADQAGRCLHCDCSGLDTCKLRHYAAQYGADPGRYPAAHHHFPRVDQPGNVCYEPGKCINCGLCIEIVTASALRPGLSFVGRGFDVRVGVPFDHTFAEALGQVAQRCIEACPTAALAFKAEGDRE
jgi:NADPH-dependent glutamate synthase beta subunit-like oxidoreductase/ferredoxin